MTPEQFTALRELSNEGYAVVVFNAEELDGASPTKLEDRLIELGWEIIDDLNSFVRAMNHEQ